MTLRLRRGTNSERLTITPVEGEIIYTTDTKQIYIGDGTTAGGNPGTVNLTNIETHVLPSDDLTYDLGSLEKQWRSLYVGTSTIFIGGVPISINTTTNTLVVGQNTTVTTATSLASEIYVQQYVEEYFGEIDPIGNTGDIGFTGTIIYNLNGLSIENSDLTHGLTSGVFIPFNGDTNGALEIVNTYGDVKIFTGVTGTTAEFVFTRDGILQLPANTGDIVDANGDSLLGLSQFGLGVESSNNPEEGIPVFALNVNTTDPDTSIDITVYQSTTSNPAIAIGKDIQGTHDSGVIAIGNDDVGYNSKRGGIYIGEEAGWNDTEDPQGEYAIAIGAFAARNFAPDNSITLNATGEHFDPDESGLFIKPIREEQYDDVILYYNTSSGEITYAANPGSNGPYTPNESTDWEGTPTTVWAALDQLAARITALQNYEIDGGNAFTEATAEIEIDGGGA